MKRLLQTIVGALYLPLLSAIAGCALPGPQAELAIRNVTIYSGRDAAAFVGSVTIADGRFIEVFREDGRRVTAERTIDGTGLFLAPGLWDMHVHVASSRDDELDVAQFVRHGVTSVRDLGGFPADVRAVRNAVAAGEAGPAIYSALQMLNGEAFADFQRVVTTPAEVEAAVAELARMGAVQVKVHRALAPDLLPAVIESAHARGLVVTGHIPLGLHPLAACEAGMDGVEHTGSFLEAWVSVTGGATPGSALEWMLSPAAEPLYRCLAEREVVVTPTLVVYPAIARQRAGGDEIPQEFADFIDGLQRVVRRLHGARVPLVAGTDTSDLAGMLPVPPGASLHEELAMLQAAGIPPATILRMATGDAARALGLANETGIVLPGRVADFLLLEHDPGGNVCHLREPAAVFQGGVAREYAVDAQASAVHEDAMERESCNR